jgi:hypothetical protein
MRVDREAMSAILGRGQYWQGKCGIAGARMPGGTMPPAGK